MYQKKQKIARKCASNKEHKGEKCFANLDCSHVVKQQTSIYATRVSPYLELRSCYWLPRVSVFVSTHPIG